MKIRLDHASASESGDYSQVLFEDDGDGAYVLIQRQFEDDDGGLCYLESHDETYIGHFHVVRAALDRHRFRLELRRQEAAEVEVTFETTDQNYNEVARVMRIMIPCVKVVDTKDARRTADHHSVGQFSGSLGLSAA